MSNYYDNIQINNSHNQTPLSKYPSYTIDHSNQNNINMNNYNNNNNNYNYNTNNSSSNNIINSVNDEDPFLPLQIESYLNSLSNWRNINDIIRLCFKSLTDTVRSQGLALREFEKILQTKCSKNDLASLLNLKANNNEVNRAINDINNVLDNKCTIDEMRTLLNEKISKSELIYYLNGKTNNEDIKTMLDEKIDNREFTNEINTINEKIENFEKNFTNKIGLFALNKDIIELKNKINEKANTIDVKNALATKANKDSIIESVDNKLNNINEINEILNEKLEIFQKNFNEIQNIINNKVDYKDFNDVKNILDQKANVLSVENKAEINDFKLISDAFQEMKISYTKRIDDIDNDLDRLIENIKTQFQSLNVVINNLENNKVEQSLFEKLNNQMNKKIDSEKYENNINKIKDDFYDTFNNFKNEIISSRKKF